MYMWKQMLKFSMKRQMFFRPTKNESFRKKCHLRLPFYFYASKADNMFDTSIQCDWNCFFGLMRFWNHSYPIMTIPKCIRKFSYRSPDLCIQILNFRSFGYIFWHVSITDFYIERFRVCINYVFKLYLKEFNCFEQRRKIDYRFISINLFRQRHFTQAETHC